MTCNLTPDPTLTEEDTLYHGKSRADKKLERWNHLYQ